MCCNKIKFTMTDSSRSWETIGSENDFSFSINTKNVDKWFGFVTFMITNNLGQTILLNILKCWQHTIKTPTGKILTFPITNGHWFTCSTVIFMITNHFGWKKCWKMHVWQARADPGFCCGGGGGGALSLLRWQAHKKGSSLMLNTCI